MQNTITSFVSQTFCPFDLLSIDLLSIDISSIRPFVLRPYILVSLKTFRAWYVVEKDVTYDFGQLAEFGVGVLWMQLHKALKGHWLILLLLLRLLLLHVELLCFR